MRKFLHNSIYCSLIAIFLPLLVQAQTPGTKVTGSNYLFYGTSSNRTANGVLTWDYLGAPYGGGTDLFDSSPYIDFHYNNALTSRKINFRMLYPAIYEEEPTEKYPFIIMLHGLGEGGGRGTLNSGYSNYPTTSDQYLNNDHQLYHGGEIHMKVVQGTDDEGPNGTPREFPGFVVFPQTSTASPGLSWTQGELDKIIPMIEDMLVTFPIDPNRIYIHGLSNGGSGVWKIVEKRPDLFAAMLPMSGVPDLGTYQNGDPYYDLSKVKEVPTWLFQGGLDTGPTPNKAHIVVNGLEDLGATPRYTEYPKLAHPTWNTAYKEDDFFSWMLGKSKLTIHAAYGDTLFCEGEDVNATLSISSGFAEYKWSKNGSDIPNSNSNVLSIQGNPSSTYGAYRVQFRRATIYSTGWTEWSDPVYIGKKPATPIALIQASGSTTLPSLEGAILPSLEGATSVTLSVPEGYESYTWQNNSATTNSITVSSGTYRVQVTEEDGCPSSFSPVVVVTKDAPRDAIVKPDGFSAEPVSSTRINLFWNDKSGNEMGFEIYRATSPGGPYAFVTKTKKDVTFYGDKGLSPNTVYYYSMRAVNDIGSSGYTDEINAQTGGDTESPSAPQNLVASTNIDLTSITLKWDESEDNDKVKNYIVYRLSNGNIFTERGVVTGNTYIDTELDEETSYTYYVVARDNSDNLSQNSNQVTETTIFCGLNYTLYTGVTYNSVSDFAPAQIKDMGTLGNFVTTPAIEYFDEINEPADYYGFLYEGYIQIETSGSYTFYITSDDGSKLYINDSELVGNDGRHGEVTKQATISLAAGKHKIAVKYFQATKGQTLRVEYSGPSIARQVIPSSVLCSSAGISSPPTPEAPTGLTATGVSENQINLSWTDNSLNETGFELYRSTSASGPFEIIFSSDADITQYLDTGLEAETVYFYRLKAINSNGSSDYADLSVSNNVSYSYYENSQNFTSVNNMETMTAKKTGLTNNFTISLADRGNRYGFIFEGQILINTPGKYTFYTRSDDGSTLHIADALVVGNDGDHGPVEKSGSFIFPHVGNYPITVKYYENGGNPDILEVRYEGPGISKTIIPDLALNTTFVSASTLSDGEDPEAPTGLTVKSVGATSVGLSWNPSTDNVGVVGYNIYKKEGTAPNVQLIELAVTDEWGDVIEEGENPQDDDVSTDSFYESSLEDNMSILSANNDMSILSENAVTKISTSVEGLEASTPYVVVVKARDATGRLSEESNSVTFTTGEESILPIELLDFFAVTKDNYIELNWITASETNNDYFEILRSLDGKVFKEIGTVDGAGNSNNILYYTFNDELPINGVMYYQLKQVDTNGVFAKFQIIRVQYNKSGATFDVRVFPNPVKDNNFEIEMTSSNEESDVYIRITDMIGRVYLDKVYPANELLSKLMMSKAGLSGGIYIISLQQAGNKIQKKIIVE